MTNLLRVLDLAYIAEREVAVGLLKMQDSTCGKFVRVGRRGNVEWLSEVEDVEMAKLRSEGADRVRFMRR